MYEGKNLYEMVPEILCGETDLVISHEEMKWREMDYETHLETDPETSENQFIRVKTIGTIRMEDLPS